MFDLPLQLDNEIWGLISFKINMKNYGENVIDSLVSGGVKVAKRYRNLPEGGKGLCRLSYVEGENINGQGGVDNAYQSIDGMQA